MHCANRAQVLATREYPLQAGLVQFKVLNDRNAAPKLPLALSFFAILHTYSILHP
jgi:hypothetical protein